MQQVPNAIDYRSPDLEFDAAVKRLGGNRELFALLAQRFEADVTTMLDQVGMQLSASEPAKAIMTMHTLKGIAGTLGTVALAQLAAEIETQLKQGHRYDPPALVVEQLQQLLQQALVALRAYVASSQASPKAVTGGTTRSDLASLASLFEEFDLLLLGANMQATQTFAALQARLDSQQPEQRNALANAMRNLNFKLALQLSKQLQKSLQ